MTVPTVHTLSVNAIHMPRTLKIDHTRPKPLRSVAVFHQDRHMFDFLVSDRASSHPKKKQNMHLLLGEHHDTPISAEWRRNAATLAATIHPATHLTPNRIRLILADMAHTGSDTHGLRHQPQ